MSLRTIQRVVMMSALTLGAMAASGCDDENTGGDKDAGTDAGNGGDDGGNPPPADSGIDAAMDNTKMCGAGADEVSCSPVDVVTGITLDACCAGEDEDACGLDMKNLEKLSADIPFKGCIEKDQPGIDSDHCTGIWERFDGDAEDATGGFTVMAGTLNLTLAGCCTPEGQCGFLTNEVMGVQLGLGCLPVEVFADSFPPSVPIAAIKAASKCDPETGGPVMGGDAGM